MYAAEHANATLRLSVLAAHRRSPLRPWLGVASRCVQWIDASIAVGSDADLVVWDPKYRGTLSAKKQFMNVDYNPFEGWEITGRPSVVTVRGEIAVKGGKFTGQLGRGKLLKREPNHF